MTSHTIIVTGATSGIGRATVIQLLHAGHNVVATGRRAERLEQLYLSQEESNRSRLLTLQKDLCEEGAPAKIAKACLEHFGCIDGLVNAAGLLEIERSHRVSQQSYQQQVNTLFGGTFLMIQAVLPQMQKQKNGLVVNLGSISGQRAAPQMVLYGACKAAVEHMTRSLAAEYAAKGIRFLCIAPGPVRSELMDPMMFAMLEKKIPLQRLGEPEEIAAWIQLLFSDNANFMTGSTITVDGGAGL